MQKAIYVYNDYKTYLQEALATTGASRGARSRLAAELGCQSGYITQVLTAYAHFSLEQGSTINKFLQHDPDESDYFLTLVSEARAGTVELRKYFAQKSEKIRQQKMEVISRVRADQKALSAEDFATLYSHWHYIALHVLASIPQYQTKTAMAQKLGLEVAVVSQALDFLTEKGILKLQNHRYSPGSSRMHLSRNSPLIGRHHMNWRLQSMRALEKENSQSEDLHYSLVFSMAKKDAAKVKAVILEAIENTEKVFIPSSEEEIFSLCMDFFRL